MIGLLKQRNPNLGSQPSGTRRRETRSLALEAFLLCGQGRCEVVVLGQEQLQVYITACKDIFFFFPFPFPFPYQQYSMNLWGGMRQK